MKKFKPTRLALVVAAVCAASPLWAQQAATDIGRITVEALPAGASTGLIIQEDSAKARSSVSREHILSGNPVGNPYQVIEMLPGVNASNQDATGMFGGGLRVRGFNSDQIGVTINGAPVNDAANFAVYPMEYTDTDNLCEVFLTQGSSDVEAPHVGASGGNVGLVTCAPADEYGFRFTQTLGDLRMRRTYVRVDTGKFADDKAKAYLSYSKSYTDKFKGAGKAERDHVDVGLEIKPNSTLSLSSSLLYNNAYINNYRYLKSSEIATSGNRLDFVAEPQTHLPAVNGTVQTEAFAANQFFDANINPFKNYLWTARAEVKLDKDTNLTVEPYFWYGTGTGGSQAKTLAESSSPTKLGGGVRDINGDGDTLDTIAVYSANVSETRKPGVTFKADTRFDNHRLLGGYWIEKSSQRQWAPFVTFAPGDSAISVLDSSKYLLLANGATVQSRDQLVDQTATSLFVQDSIGLMDDKLNIQVGLANRSMTRIFTNYANTASSTVNGVTYSSGADYVLNQTYSAVLPNVGFKFNIDEQQQVFLNVAGGMRAPNKDSSYNLIKGGTYVNGVLTGYGFRDTVLAKETSTNLDLGYRFSNADLVLSSTLFAVDFQNRIATAYDPATGISTDTNVGAVKTFGGELEAGFKVTTNWSVYGSLTYTSAKMQSDLPAYSYSSPQKFEATSGKQLPDTPEWMSGIRLNYVSGPWYGNLDTKYTGQAYSTLVNDESVDARTIVNASLGYDLGKSGFVKKSSIQLNVANLFDQQYVQISSSSGGGFTTRAITNSIGSGSSPSYIVGAPRFASVTYRAEF